MGKNSEDDKEIINKLYERILETANYFLASAKLFSIETLQEADPSYAELAKIMKSLAVFISTFGYEDDPSLAGQANDYVYLMGAMALAINNSDDSELERLTQELNKKPFINP